MKQEEVVTLGTVATQKLEEARWIGDIVWRYSEYLVMVCLFNHRKL